jgi:glycosyltransferase involved in cell wall biosynthesis
VLGQEAGPHEFEVIVVKDSGDSLAQEGWMASKRVRILQTKRRNRSVARNCGAAIACGRYLHFLDDDDWILPGAIRRFAEIAATEQSAWIYGGFQLVNNQGDLLQEILPTETGNCSVQLLASEWLPLQASWIRSDVFFSVGGFAPLNSLGGGYEDIHISRMVSHYHDFSRLLATVAVIRFGDTTSTTNYDDLVQQNRRSREKILDLPGAYPRIRSSAQGAPYWRGRIAYYYLASVRWNLKQRRLTRAASRAIYFLRTLASPGSHWVSPAFWRGVWRPHLNLVRTSLGTAGSHLFPNTVWKR